MNVAVVGFDVEGRASYEYFKSLGYEVTICDQNTNISIPDEASAKLGESYLNNLDEFDVIVRTPGLHPNNILKKNESVAHKITSGTNEFLKVCPSPNIIGVTGTKGKGTTSSLITDMLEAAGKTVHLGGNIGRAALDILPEIKPDDWVVLELSNFQLIDIKYSPHIAVCLMVVPEHLDWHADAEEYYEAKKQLFKNQNADDITIYYVENEITTEITRASPGHRIPYCSEPGAHVENDAIVIAGQTICRVEELKLLGAHNWQNVCAATTAVWQITQDVPALREALTTFSGLENRLEFVRELDGIRYYNDSFGTTPETAIVAMQAFSEPKVVILGGSDKGASYDKLASTVANSNVRAALIIGDTGPAIREALTRAGFNNCIEGGSTMDEIVANARLHAKEGDIVLLSTGCASFGMFQNYKDRGYQFKQAASTLVSTEQ